jgi:hypothetical protein
MQPAEAKLDSGGYDACASIPTAMSATKKAVRIRNECGIVVPLATTRIIGTEVEAFFRVNVPV